MEVGPDCWKDSGWFLFEGSGIFSLLSRLSLNGYLQPSLSPQIIKRCHKTPKSQGLMTSLPQLLSSSEKRNQN